VERVTPGIEIEREASAKAAVGGDILPRILDASGVLQVGLVRYVARHVIGCQLSHE
jgi:hypothetical protein